MSSDDIAKALDACLERLDDLSETLAQWLGSPVTLTPSDPVPLASADLSNFANGRWLAVAVGEGVNGLLAALSETVLPPEALDEGGVPSGGSTEAVGGLVRLLALEAAESEAFCTKLVTDFSDTLGKAKPSDAAQLLVLDVKYGDEKEGTLLLIGPIAGALADDEKEAPTAAGGTAKPGDATIATVEHLPPSVQALLRVAVPVSVTLAEKKLPLGKILDLGPGMIVQFDKSCDDLIDLNVNWHKIGKGEAMKVGEEFGIKITEIFSPAERAAILARTPDPDSGPSRNEGSGVSG